MHFIHDRLTSGESIRILSVVDVFTRECIALVPQMRFRGTTWRGASASRAPRAACLR
jgi:hypothetical protein